MKNRTVKNRTGSIFPAPDLFASLAMETSAPQAAATPSRRVYTVSQITRDIKLLLEAGFPDVWVEGEISNFKQAASGHSYFSLKDAQAQVHCVCFKSANQRLKFTLADGQQVLCGGRISVFEGRGQYQLYVEQVEPKGRGALQLAFEQLKERLQKEGLFDQARKRPLPLYVERIGIVTSPTGAVIHDIIQNLHGQFPTAILNPVKVQGEGAAQEIARAIAEFNALDNVDVLIVGRGGGSLEDLWAFNEEIVARAIVQSRIPVMSAVGHEPDVTIADFVADYRAATPTAAARELVQRKQALAQRVAELQEALTEGARQLLDERRVRLDELTLRLAARHPQVLFNEQWAHLEDLAHRLQRQMAHQLQFTAERVRRLRRALEVSRPQAVLERLGQRLAVCAQRLPTAMRHRLALADAAFRQQAAALETLSPLAILGRGYSVSFADDGRLITRAHQVHAGERVRTRVSRGAFTSRVETVDDTTNAEN